MNSEAGTNRPTPSTGGIPCQTHARLQQQFRIILGEARMPDQRIAEWYSTWVKQKVGAPALHLVPAIRHLVSQSQAEREIRLQLHFILDVPGP